MANYVKFKQGLKKDFNTTNQPLTNGMIYFVIDENNHGSIYYDTIVDGKKATKNGTVHRVKFSGLPIKITGSVIGTGVISQDGETIEINTSTNHSHGLAHQDFTVTLSDDNTNLKWTRLGNQNGGGFWLKSIRGQTKAPAWFLPDYSAGIAFGGADTKGIISIRYSQPGVRFAGGNGDAPVWYFTITGSNDKTYDLNGIGGHSSDSAKLDHNVTFKIASTADATKGGNGTATNLSGSAVDLYLPTKISGFDLLQATRFQGNADTSTVAAKLGRDGNTSLPMTFYWNGQGGQPTWLWGGENGTDMYVYNPSNFKVAHSVSTAGLDHDVTFKISKVANATTGETGVVTKLTGALLELILPASISGFNLIQSTRFQGNADSATVASRANSLFLNPSNRQENINYQINSDQYQSRVTYSLASSITKTGKPPVGDSHVLTFGWDGSGWGAQLAITADAKPHIAIRGAKASEKGVSIWDETWSTVLDSSNYTSYINNYYWADVKVSTTANAKTNPNFFNVTSSGWFFSNAPSTGWQNSAHGGGIYMKDSSYVRIYGGKKFAVENTDSDSINTTGGVKASGGFTSDSGTMKVYAEFNNEINFGGTNGSNTVYFGYRKKDSKEIPSIFIFGSDTGTANIQANAGWFGQKYLSGDNWIGWYAAKGDASSKRYGYIQTDISDNGNMRFVKEGGGYFTFNSHVNPNQTNAYDLGTQALAWRTLYVNNLSLYGQTANRLVWTNANKTLIANNHYAASDRIAINSTSAPEYNFYVNGTSLHTNTITINPNTVAMDFRNYDAYHTTISYQTSGNEALVFASNSSLTSFMFVNGEDSIANHGSNRWQSLTNTGLQIKENCVQIGGLWGNGVHPDYKLKVNGTSYFTDYIRIPHNKSLIQDQNSTSNYTSIIEWRKGGGAGQSDFTYNPQVGQHNTGGADGSGSVCVLPYATSTYPWGGSVGLFITKNKLMLDNCRVPTTGNTSGNIGFASQPVYVNNGVITAITGSIANDTTGKAAGLSYYSIDNNLTVAQAKDQIRSKLTNKGIAAAVLSSSYINQWNTNTASYYDSSVHSVIALNPGYDNTRYGHFLVAHYGDRDLRHIGVDEGNWGSLRTLLDSVNYTSYTVTKTGSGASGTWNININGNATTATTASKLSRNAGSATKPIYFSGGVPVQCNDTLGVNISGNAATATVASSANKLNTSAGGSTNPIYFTNGVPVRSTASVGSANQPVYLNNGVITACAGSQSGTEKQQSFKINGNNGTAHWYYLGNLVSNGDNSEVIIDIYSGNGFNSTGDQNTHISIFVKDGWQSTQAAASSFGISYLVDHSDVNATAIKVKGMASAHNVIDLYVYLPWGYSDGYYSIKGYYSAWTHKGIRSTTEPTSGKVQNCVLGSFRASQVYGAVWNDYAEYRQTKKYIQPGYCVIETGRGDLIKSSERLQPGANIVSDTFGFAIGETEYTKTPLAVSGRVLAYPYEDRDSYQAGDPVCSGPNGTISKMTRKEVREYPDRIIGTVSEIPDYEVWGTGNVKVNGRIWIKVK